LNNWLKEGGRKRKGRGLRRVFGGYEERGVVREMENPYEGKIKGQQGEYHSFLGREKGGRSRKKGKEISGRKRKFARKTGNWGAHRFRGRRRSAKKKSAKLDREGGVREGNLSLELLLDFRKEKASNFQDAKSEFQMQGNGAARVRIRGSLKWRKARRQNSSCEGQSQGENRENRGRP